MPVASEDFEGHEVQIERKLSRATPNTNGHPPDAMDMLNRSSTKLYSGSLDIDSTASSTGKEREGHKAPADALSGPQVTVNHGSTGRVQRHRTRKDSRHESWLHLPSALLPSSMVRPRRQTRRQRATESILAGIRRHYGSALNVLSYIALGLVLYAALYLLLGGPMLPPNKGWAVFLLWICAHAGGYIAARANLPPLLGMLVAGIILQNIPQDPVHNLPSSWGTKIRTGGLAVILLRAGLKIDKVAFNRAPLVVLRLALVPMLCEAVVDSWLYYWLFKMPIALSFTAGFIQSAISPTVLVTGMLELQRQGLGQDKVIPSIMMAAAGLDSIGAIVGFAVASGVGIASGNLIYSILSGPLQVVYGLIVGAGCAFICSWTRLWNNVFKRTAALLISALATMWLGLKFEYLGGSSVGCLSLGILVSFAWERGFPPYLCKGARLQYPRECDAKLAVVWIILVQPLLFGAIGIEINFHQIQGYVIPRTLVIVAIGVLCTRFPAALLVLFGAGFNKKEQLFLASSWVPKATVQGALGSVPLLLIQSRLTKKADYTQYEKWGNEILHATAFSILITAPVGLLVIGLLGKTCLKQGIPPTTARVPSEHVVRAASDDDDSSPAVSDVETATASRRRTQQQDALSATALPNNTDASDDVKQIDLTAVPKTESSAWPTPMLSPFATSVQHHPDATRTQQP